MTLLRGYTEGADDHAVFTGLSKAGLIAPNVEFAKASGGEPKLVPDAMPFVMDVGGTAIVFRDCDGMSARATLDWFEDQARQHFGVHVANRLPSLRCIEIRAGKGRMYGVVVGRVDDAAFRAEHSITHHAIDDHVLQLALTEAIYRKLHHQIAPDVPHALAVKKLREVPDLLRRNGIAVTSSKRLMHILRAITGFRASPATFVDELFKAAKKAGVSLDVLRQIHEPLLTDITDAIAAATRL